MIDYVDVIPPVRKLLASLLDVKVYGNTWPTNINTTLPGVLVRTTGGNDYTRIQLVARANDDITAMQNVIKAMNALERYAADIQGLKILWLEREANPVSTPDVDTGKPEAWCFMRMEHMEA